MVFAALFLHHLETVVEVLPQHIQGRDDAAQRIEIALGHPDGQHRVLLTEGLSSRHIVAIALANAVAHKKLEETKEDGDGHHPKEHGAMLLELGHQQPDGTGDDHRERHRPNIERDALVTVDGSVGLGPEN